MLSESNPNRERIQLWVEALESGEFHQAQGCLREQQIKVDGEWKLLTTGFSGAEARDAHCCLGVAIEVALRNGVKVTRQHSNWGHGSLWPEVADWYGFGDDDPTIGEVRAVRANDRENWSFTQIAEGIRNWYLLDGKVRHDSATE